MGTQLSWLHAMQALSQLSYGPTRGAATYGSASGMSSKQKRLHHILLFTSHRTRSPNFRVPSLPVSASYDTLKKCKSHVLLLTEQGQTRRETGTQSFRSEVSKGSR
jgi:hypothetical protein